MNLHIRNANNIVDGQVTITENRLNIKYAMNGTGKSSIAKAIEYTANHDDASLQTLIPFQYSGDAEAAHQPSVEGLEEGIRVAIFDEDYISNYVFQDDDLLKDSFEVFVKNESFDRNMTRINGLIANIRNMFTNNPDFESLIGDMNDFISSFGSSRTSVAASSAINKGLKSGNLIRNIPQGLEDFSPFLENEQNSKWLKWQASGKGFMDLSDRCPFCACELAPRRERIERIFNEYDSKNIEHLAKVLDVFERLGHYFSDETNAMVREITQSVNGLTAEQKNYLQEIRSEVETLCSKLIGLQSMGFNTLKTLGTLSVAIPGYKIDLRLFHHLNSPYTEEKVGIINSCVDELLNTVGELQGAVNIQQRSISETVRKYSSEINDFLRNAGYTYQVSLEESTGQTYRLLLRYGDGTDAISDAKRHLSFGERNAFALTLFMYQSLHTGANLIILDDPISSFDANKKFAILDRLFVKGNSFRGKTVLLLTHDFEPILDAIYNHSDYFEGSPIAHYLDNNEGILLETQIDQEAILSSVTTARRQAETSDNPISKVIFLRRYFELVKGKNGEWDLLSNIIHKRAVPENRSRTPMTQEEILEAEESIKELMPEFDYAALVRNASDCEYLKRIYEGTANRYEKLHIFRMLFDRLPDDHILRKFINGTYHVENDYLFQLNPAQYNTIPKYIIDECDAAVTEL